MNSNEMPKPTDTLKRGRYQRCRRCHCTGQARHNNLNGDTYCYLCNGLGWQVVYSKDERAAMEAEAAWYEKAYMDGYQLKLDVRKAARRAGVDRGRALQLATFWVGAGLGNMGTDYTEEAA